MQEPVSLQGTNPDRCTANPAVILHVSCALHLTNPLLIKVKLKIAASLSSVWLASEPATTFIRCLRLVTKRDYINPWKLSAITFCYVPISRQYLSFYHCHKTAHSHHHLTVI